MRRGARRGEECCFTLIELLVVVAILAILMTLLLPALKSCRSTAQKILCTKNLQEVGSAMWMYIDDHNGYALYSDYRWNFHYGPVQEKFMERTLCSYLKYPSFVSAADLDNLPPAPSSRCPSGGLDGTMNPRRSSGNPNFSYQINRYLWGRADNASACRPVDVKTPSTRIYFADINTNSFDGYSVISPRHNSSANISFLDNHVENWTLPRILNVLKIKPGLWYDE